MPAKPIIDILVGVDVEHQPALHAAIAALGYECLGEAGIPGRVAFRRRHTTSYNIALVRASSQLWNDNIAVRDYLRSHADVARAYGELKVELGGTHATLLGYSDAKAQFMNNLVRDARAWAPRTTLAP